MYKFYIIFFSNFIPIDVTINNETKKLNIYEYVEEILGNWSYTFIIIIIYIILSLISSFTRVFSKKIMNEYYKLIYKIVFMVGIFGFIYTLITLIFTTFFKCNQTIKRICKINEHFDIINVYFSDLKIQFYYNKFLFFIEILIVTPLYLFIGFIQFTFEILIIYHLNPNFILISDCLYFGFKRVLNFIFEIKDIHYFSIILLQKYYHY